MKRKSTSFTLIELLVVIAIIAILMAILLPSLKQSPRPMPIFHCPVFATGPFDGSNNYMAPHAIGPRSLRNRMGPWLSVGGGRDGHYLAESVGWTDGHAAAVQQPGAGGIWYMNCNGEVTNSQNSLFR